MGFEVALFVGEIDENLICTICYMVLENPMVLPCEHVYCANCIRGWLVVESICPVERQLVHSADLRSAPRYFRNVLNNLRVRCEFSKLT